MSVPSVTTTSKLTQEKIGSDNQKVIDQTFRDFGMSSISKTPVVNVSNVKTADYKEKK